MAEITITPTIIDDVVVSTEITENNPIFLPTIIANGQGGDPVGTASGLMAAHVAAGDPHAQYQTEAAFLTWTAGADPLPQYVLESELGVVAGAILKSEPGPYAVVSGTGGDLTGNINTLLENAHTAGGGVVVVPPGANWTSDQTITVKENCILWMYGAQVTYTGSSDAIFFDNTDGTGVKPGPRCYGGWLKGTSAARNAIYVEDSNSCRIADMKITGFIGFGGDIVDNIRGAAVHLRNVGLWSELFRAFNCDFSGNRHDLVTTGASITGGTGTDSFARLRFLMCTHSGGSALFPKFLLRGNTYHGSLTHLAGNIPANVPVFGFGAGSHGGTVVSHLGFEQTGSGASLFTLVGAGPSIMPIALPPVHVLSPMAEWSGTVGDFGTVQHRGAQEYVMRANPLAAATGAQRAWFGTDGRRYYRGASGGPLGSTVRKVLEQSDLDAHTGDTVDAHDASAISIADAGGLYTATQVEAALQEVMAQALIGTDEVAHVEYDASTSSWPFRPSSDLVIWSAESISAAGDPPQFQAGDLLVSSSVLSGASSGGGIAKVFRVSVGSKQMGISTGTPTEVIAANGMPGWQMTFDDAVVMAVPALPPDWQSVELELVWSTTATTNGGIIWRGKVGSVNIGKVLAAGVDTADATQAVSTSNHASGTVFSTTLRYAATGGGRIIVDGRESAALRITPPTGFATGPMVLHEVRLRKGDYNRILLMPNLAGTWWTRPRCTVNSAGKAFVGGIKAYNAAIGATAISTVDLAVTPPGRTENSVGQLEEDDHNNGALLVPTTTRVPLTFYCTHGADNTMRYRIGAAVGNIDTLHSQTLRTIDAGETITYAEAFGRIAENEVHLLTRGDPGWIYFRSTNWAAVGSWSAKVRVFDLSGAQIYVASSLKTDGRTLRCAVFPHPSTFTGLFGVNHDIWCYDIDLQTGDITRPEAPAVVVGNVQTGTGLPIDETQTPSYSCPVGRTVHVFDVGSGSTPMVVFAEKDLEDDATNNSTYRLLVFTGGQWVVRDIASTGQHFGHVFGYYVGGGAIKLHDDSTVYLSREKNGVWTIEKWVTADLGETWTSEVLDELDQPLVRPFAVDGDTSRIEATYYRVHRYDFDPVTGNSGYDDDEFFMDMHGI